MESLLWGRLVSKKELSQHVDSGDELERLIQKSYVTEMIINDTCSRCGNQDKNKFSVIKPNLALGINKIRRYCVACLQMGRMIEGEYLYHLPEPLVHNETTHSYLTWTGTLSSEQDRASKSMIKSLDDRKYPHMIHAVTGAGKTEMIFPLINEVLMRGGRVGVASPRIDVCIELSPRIAEAFNTTKIALLHGQSKEPYEYTQIVICTTHQLLRFKSAFDVLIVDEVDAFPYINNEMLHFAVNRAVKQNGKLIYLTATPDHYLQKKITQGELTVTTLPARYHRHALPEPIFEWIGDWRLSILNQQCRSKLWKILIKFIHLKGVKLIFMPNIRLAEALFAWLIRMKPDWNERLACVHSKDLDRNQKVQNLRDGVLDTLITTTILERGVTFTNCHVCVIGAENKIYNTATLVQMSGRVGRRQNYPTGILVYAHNGISQSMKQAHHQIIKMNSEARRRGLIDY